MTITVSVVILTKNRVLYLEKCLQSLVGQISIKDEVVVVDNNSTDETRVVLANYAHVLPLAVFRVGVRGYSLLYNYAIKKCTKEVVVFLDDDCVADVHFIDNIKKVHKRNTGDILLQGATRSVPRGNIYAEIMGDHYQNWLTANMVSEHELGVFDNKNASISMALLRRCGMFSKDMTSGSEDVELGIRLRRHGVRILLEPSIVVYHHERSTLSGFISQHLRIARSEALLDRTLHKEERITMVNYLKLRLNVKSAFYREVSYMRRGRVQDALLLPFLYFLLAFIRILGYKTAR